MRILLHGQAPWTKTAYGHQLQLLTSVLQDCGVEEIGQSVTFGLQGRVLDVGGVAMLPSDGDPFGNRTIARHYNYFRPHVVLSLMDVFGADPRVWGQFKWLPWVTIDSQPLWPEIRRALTVCYQPIAYSRYASEVLQAEGWSTAVHIPLMYSKAEFYEVPFTLARTQLGIPSDAYVIAIVQANRQRDDRKNFGNQLRAFAEFHRLHPQAFLYLHTCRDSSRGGVDLDGLLKELGLTENVDYKFTDQYQEALAGSSDSHMRNIYSAANVLLQATRAEGFGVPTIEAMACGTQVVYTNHGPMRDIALGHPVDCGRVWNWGGSWWADPQPEQIVQSLEIAHDQPWDSRDCQARAAEYEVEYVRSTFWQPYLDTLRQELGV